MRFFVSIILIIFYINSSAQINGYTTTGDPILLYKNGTWKYLKLDTLSEAEKVADSLLSAFENQFALVGKWKMTLLRMTDKESSKIIQVNLTSPQSIKFYTDTFFYGGLYGKLKLDKSEKAKKEAKETASFFEGMQNTYLVLNSDSSYILDNQPTLFGIAVNSVLQTKIKGNWSYRQGERMIELKVAKDESRSYKVIKQNMNTLVIDEEWRDENDFPIKEITMTKQ